MESKLYRVRVLRHYYEVFTAEALSEKDAIDGALWRMFPSHLETSFEDNEAVDIDVIPETLAPEQEERGGV